MFNLDNILVHMTGIRHTRIFHVYKIEIPPPHCLKIVPAGRPVQDLSGIISHRVFSLGVSSDICLATIRHSMSEL